MINTGAPATNHVTQELIPQLTDTTKYHFTTRETHRNLLLLCHGKGYRRLRMQQIRVSRNQLQTCMPWKTISSTHIIKKKNAETRVPREPILRAQVADKNAGTHCILASHTYRYYRSCGWCDSCRTSRDVTWQESEGMGNVSDFLCCRYLAKKLGWAISWGKLPVQDFTVVHWYRGSKT